MIRSSTSETYLKSFLSRVINRIPLFTVSRKVNLFCLLLANYSSRRIDILCREFSRFYVNLLFLMKYLTPRIYTSKNIESKIAINLLDSQSFLSLYQLDKLINIIISTNKPIRPNFKNNRFKLEINRTVTIEQNVV